MHDNIRQLKAVFRVSPQDLYDIVTYGRVLRKSHDPVLRTACDALGTRNIIIGAGYIGDTSSEAIAKELVPLGHSSSLWLTVKLDSSYKYLTAPSTLLRQEPGYTTPIIIKSWDRDYFPDAPDTAVIMGQIEAKQIVKVEAVTVSAIRELASIPPSLTWWERFKRDWRNR